MSYKRVLLTPSTIFEPKYRTQLCNFPNFRLKYPKLSILTENWVTWYLGGADSKSRLLKHFWNSNPKIHFLANLGPKSQTCPFCLKIGTQVISRMLILFPRKLILVLVLVFWISYQKSILGKFGPKKSKFSILPENWHIWYLKEVNSCSGSSFLNLLSKIHFGQVWAKKVKVVRFVWKLAHLVSRGCGVLFRN